VDFDIRELIEAKRRGEALTGEEIEWFVEASAKGQAPDDCLASLLMAITVKGLEEEEIEALARAIASHCPAVSLSDLPYPVVDLHDTGAVGSKALLAAIPIVAAYGVKVGLLVDSMSGLACNVIDKLRAVPGACALSSMADYEKILRGDGGVAIVDYCAANPAARSLAVIRQRTGTMPSIPLIAGSILARKISSGATGCLVNVQAGSGALMRDIEEARELAALMMHVGDSLGLHIRGLITNAEQPVGQALGSSLEIREVLAALRGEAPADLQELVEIFAGQMLVAGQKTVDLDKGRLLAQEVIRNGKARQKFGEMLVALGGDQAVVAEPELMPVGPRSETLRALREGAVKRIDMRAIAMALACLGGSSATGALDPRVGLELHKKVGDNVQGDEPLVTLHYSEKSSVDDARRLVEESYLISPSKVESRNSLILEMLQS
jgi:pyrimidine-nucleoside phosphorylase